MKVALPDPPSRLGCSKRVRRRVGESVPAVRVAWASLEILGEAIDRRWGDRLARDREAWEREVKAAAGASERPITVADLVWGIGCEIRSLADKMAAADEELDGARRHRRRCCRQRDTVKRALYGELGHFRKNARGILQRRARRVPELRGETVRDPQLLIQQTDDCLRWATSLGDSSLQPPETWTAMIVPLRRQRDELAAALRGVDASDAAVRPALELRDRAMAVYDDFYLKGVRMLERFYAYLDLPSLAAAVRPHRKVTARVGRPSKTRRVDKHPDLVERVLARLRESIS